MSLIKSSIARSNLKLAGCGIVFTALAACASAPPDKYVAHGLTPTEHFAVETQEQPDQVALAVHAEGVSAHQQAALSEFAARWREAGGGAVVVKAPADAAEPDKAKSMAYAVKAQLEVLGVPPDRIQLASYQAGAPNGPILTSFLRLTAQGPDCSGGWDNLSSTMGNEPYRHFGCAITANFAAQVADPRDFVSPPGLAPADNVRRQTVLNKYRDGKLTASDKDDQASGAVSSAVK
jgi:pilus assembly protein CpaD